jgi:hypothetical protein
MGVGRIARQSDGLPFGTSGPAIWIMPVTGDLEDDIAAVGGRVQRVDQGKTVARPIAALEAP